MQNYVFTSGSHIGIRAKLPSSVTNYKFIHRKIISSLKIVYL